jgi:hypothetical protein
MTMPDTTVATNLNETLYIKVNRFPQFTLNLLFLVDNLSETINLIIGEVIHLGLSSNTRLSQNFPTQGGTNPIDILQRDPNLFILGYIYTSYARHLQVSSHHMFSPASVYALGWDK